MLATRIRIVNYLTTLPDELYRLIDFRHQYSTLDELVEYCKKNNQRGLACKLANVCIKQYHTKEQVSPPDAFRLAIASEDLKSY